MKSELPCQRRLHLVTASDASDAILHLSQIQWAILFTPVYLIHIDTLKKTKPFTLQKYHVFVQCILIASVYRYLPSTPSRTHIPSSFPASHLLWLLLISLSPVRAAHILTGVVPSTGHGQPTSIHSHKSSSLSLDQQPLTAKSSSNNNHFSRKYGDFKFHWINEETKSWKGAVLSSTPSNS